MRSSVSEVGEEGLDLISSFQLSDELRGEDLVEKGESSSDSIRTRRTTDATTHFSRIERRWELLDRKRSFVLAVESRHEL